MKAVMATLITLGFIGFLLLTVSEMPALGSDFAPAHNGVMAKYVDEAITDTGAINIVSAIILDYRAFDTLIEATVLFSALIVIFILIRNEVDDDK